MSDAPRIGVAIVAAGASTRFGAGDKLMAQLRGRPLCAHIAQTVAQVPFERRMAICASTFAAPAQIFLAHGFEVLGNGMSATGMASSLRLACNDAKVAGLDALVICLADMPFVSVALLNLLVRRWLETNAVAVIARSQTDYTWKTPPALISRSLFPVVEGIAGDTGARSLLHTALPLDTDPALLADFDTPEDFS